jgi:hypothetical protein
MPRFFPAIGDNDVMLHMLFKRKRQLNRGCTAPVSDTVGNRCPLLGRINM